MANRDDLNVMGTISQSLNDSVQTLRSTGSMPKSTEQDVLDLTNLIYQVLLTDVHPGRMQQLLFNVSPAPLGLLLSFMSPQLGASHKVRVTCCKIFCQTIALLTTPQCVDHLGPALRSHLSYHDCIPVLLDICSDAVALEEATLTAEALFVLCMKIISIREDVRSADGIRVLCNTLFVTEHQAELEGYLAALVRVFVESYTDHFVDLNFGFVQKSLKRILGETSRYALVLLLESLTCLFTKFPSHYWSTVPVDKETGMLFQNLLEELFLPLQPSREEEKAKALLDFVAAVIDVEGKGNPTTEPLAVGLLGSPQSWRVLVGKIREGGGPTSSTGGGKEEKRGNNAAAVSHAKEDKLTADKLSLLRSAVSNSYTLSGVRKLQQGFREVFPKICSLLNPQLSHSGGGGGEISKEIITELSLLIGLMLAKCPSMRLEVSTMVQGYEGWALALLGMLKLSIGSCPFSVLKGTLVVDVNQCVLNDGDQAQHVEQLDEDRIAAALLIEQEKRVQHRTAPQTIDYELISFLKSDEHYRISDLTYRLCVAILVQACTMALNDVVYNSAGAEEKHSSAHRQNRMPPPPSHEKAPKGGGNYSPRTPRPQTADRSGISPVPSPAGLGHKSDFVSDVNTPSRSLIREVLKDGSNKQQTPTRSRQQSAKSRSPLPSAAAWLSEPVKGRSPFRPASPSTNRTARVPVMRTSPVPATSPTPRLNPDGSVVHGGSGARTLADCLRSIPGTEDEYLTMAMMMHLPILLGIHYNRHRKGAVRKMDTPYGPFVQPVRRNTQQTWTTSDVYNGELYVLFLPFHRITIGRLQEEVQTIERHISSVKKLMTTTPNSLRSRRWFLHDMLHYILPKTRMLLEQFLELLEQFGVDDVVYQMGLIRVVDESRREKDGLFEAAVQESDSALPQEILRFSSGKYKDILHSGNIAYAIKRLREHYYEQAVNAEAEEEDELAASGLPEGMQQLNSIDKEIRKLERRAEGDVWGQQVDAEQGDDVESDYEMEENLAPASVGYEGLQEGEYQGERETGYSQQGNWMQAQQQQQQPQRGEFPQHQELAQQLAQQQSDLPPHLRQKLNTESSGYGVEKGPNEREMRQGAPPPPTTMPRPLPSSMMAATGSTPTSTDAMETRPPQQQNTDSRRSSTSRGTPTPEAMKLGGGGANVAASTLADFDDMYATVEASMKS